jgi:predicted metalloprotease with PDZ domain
MRTFVAPVVVSFCLAARSSAQVDYSLTLERGAKSWKVEARLPGRGEDSFDFHFALWTPGAYHVAEYGRFVKELGVFDEHGSPLAVERVDKGHFVVTGAGGAKEIVLRYEAQSISSGQFTNNVIDVEANRISTDYAYVNPVSLFGFVPARAQEGVSLALHLPDGWKVATVLEHDDQGRFLAPTYYRFEDSPLLFSPTLETARFTVDGKPHTVSVHGRNAEDTQAIAAGCQRIVEAGAKLMQGLPYDRYQFLYGFVPEGGGSGLEHSFSTLIQLDPAVPIADDPTVEKKRHGPDAKQFWGITAHEYFHLWCAERIHVQEIHRPDLTEPLETGTIWVNEGITEYFSRHLLFHAGFYDEEELLQSYLEGRGMEGMLGKKSWTDVSRAAADWKGMGDLMTFAVRMYMLGPPTIFALDMEMRRGTQGERGVLDLLRYLMRQYVEQDRGFGEDELGDILEAVGGQSAVDFYERYIDGDQFPDAAQFLDVLGYRAAAGKLQPLEELDEGQARARRDYFSASGQP